MPGEIHAAVRFGAPAGACDGSEPWRPPGLARLPALDHEDERAMTLKFQSRGRVPHRTRDLRPHIERGICDTSRALGCVRHPCGCIASARMHAGHASRICVINFAYSYPAGPD